jgi:hypothetical protein
MCSVTNWRKTPFQGARPLWQSKHSVNTDRELSLRKKSVPTEGVDGCASMGADSGSFAIKIIRVPRSRIRHFSLLRPAPQAGPPPHTGTVYFLMCVGGRPPTPGRWPGRSSRSLGILGRAARRSMARRGHKGPHSYTGQQPEALSLTGRLKLRIAEFAIGKCTVTIASRICHYQQPEVSCGLQVPSQVRDHDSPRSHRDGQLRPGCQCFKLTTAAAPVSLGHWQATVGDSFNLKIHRPRRPRYI